MTESVQTSSPSILIVDDEDAIRSALTTLLGRAGFNVRAASSGAEALAMIAETPPDLVLLDVVLDEGDPGALSGLGVLRQVRGMARFVPVIMLTSYTEWQFESLGHGAIAFVTKPWDAQALILQIRATLGAVAHIREEAAAVAPGGAASAMTLRAGDISIDLERYRVSRAGDEIDLTPMEFALLVFFARNPNRQWTREQLLNQVWGYDWVGYERTVDRHIAALRRKLRLGRDELIETVHGMGYRMPL